MPKLLQKLHELKHESENRLRDTPPRHNKQVTVGARPFANLQDSGIVTFKQPELEAKIQPTPTISSTKAATAEQTNVAADSLGDTGQLSTSGAGDLSSTDSTSNTASCPPTKRLKLGSPSGFSLTKDKFPPMLDLSGIVQCFCSHLLYPHYQDAQDVC